MIFPRCVNSNIVPRLIQLLTRRTPQWNVSSKITGTDQGAKITPTDTSLIVGVTSNSQLLKLTIKSGQTTETNSNVASPLPIIC